MASADVEAACVLVGADGAGKKTLADRARVGTNRDVVLSSEHRPSTVVVVASIAELQRGDEDAARAAADRARHLLDDIAVPADVTVIFTHADSIAGFVETFGDLANRKQAFGAYVGAPTEARSIVEGFNEELEILLDRVRLRVIDRCRASESEQLDAILSFPNELAALAPKLGAYLERLFEPRGVAPPRLGGFYFTAVTPADDFFIHDLFARILFAGSDAARERARRKRRSWRNASLCALIAALAVATTVPFVRSYVHNRALLATWDRAVSDAGRIDWCHEYCDRAPTLDAVLAVLQRHEAHVDNGVPSELGWGMYVGDRLYDPTVKLHAAAVRGWIVDGTHRHLERRLSSVSGPLSTDGPDYVEFQRDLALYLMLGDPDRLDPRRAAEQCAQIRASYPAQTAPTETVARSAMYHFERIVAEREPPLPLDEGVIAKARAKLDEVARSDPANVHGR